MIFLTTSDVAGGKGEELVGEYKLLDSSSGDVMFVSFSMFVIITV